MSSTQPTFVAASNGDLISVAGVTCIRPRAGRSRLGVVVRAELVLPDGSTVSADRSLLDDIGPLAGWPELEDGTRLNPITVAKIENGVLIGRRGETLGRVVNLDHLRALNGAGGESPDAVNAVAAPTAPEIETRAVEPLGESAESVAPSASRNAVGTRPAEHAGPRKAALAINTSSL